MESRRDRAGQPEKAVNDTFGHLAGDRCLVRIAEILASRVRASDLVVRFGGEEFAVLLSDTSEHEALALAEHLRRVVAGAPMAVPGPQESTGVTVSVGATSLGDDEDQSSLDAVLERVDRALYTAKKRGRDQVCGGESEGPWRPRSS